MLMLLSIGEREQARVWEWASRQVPSLIGNPSGSGDLSIDCSNLYISNTINIAHVLEIFTLSFSLRNF